MGKLSAGVLLYRLRADHSVELLLVHPGGPFFARKDDGWWSLPKGEPEADEPLIEAARRELLEEVGVALPADALLALGHVRQKGGKTVHGWAALWAGRLSQNGRGGALAPILRQPPGAPDPAEGLPENTFEMEWPPRSGRRASFPEVDRAEWFRPDAAMVKLNAAQAELVPRLLTLLTE